MCLSSSEIVSLACVFITGVVSVLITFINNRDYSKRKYEKRQESIRDALSFLDSFCSWLTYNSGIEPVRGPIKTQEEMTIEARKCYEQLCVSVENKRLIELFLDIILNKCDVFQGFLEFRELARHELGLKSIKLDKDNIFLSIISTEVLKAK